MTRERTPPGTYIFAAVATLPGALADGLNPGDIVAQSTAQLTVP